MKAPFVPRYVRFLFRRINPILQRTLPHENSLLLLLSFAVGIGSGLGAIGFERLIEVFETQFSRELWHLPLGRWSAPVNQLGVLVTAGVVVGILVATLAKSSRGHGVPYIMASVALRGGRIPPRVALDTAVTAGACIGAGGSAGPEGPIVQIGSAIGSGIGQVMRVSTERLRVLAACGAAGGISAIFGAPLAGVMFAVEVILGDFAVQSLTPIVISSVLAAVTHQFFVAWEPRFRVAEHGFIHLHEVPSILALGVLAAGVSWLFIRVLCLVEDSFHRWRFPVMLKPAVGMLGVGAIAFLLPGVLGGGYHMINNVLDGNLPFKIMAALVLAKLVATCLTVGSGNVGGLFGPSLVVGAMLGGSFGAMSERWIFPHEQGMVAVYALVGMGALIAGTTRATITAILLVFELSNDYAIILPTMLAAATAVVISSRLSRESIYTVRLVREGIHLRRGVEITVMGSLRVRDVMQGVGQTIPQSMQFTELLDLIERSADNTFSVVDGKGFLVGVLSYQDIRSVLSHRGDPGLDPLIVAGDIATPDPVTVHPGQTLNDAMRLFGLRDLSMLPVVEKGDASRLLGVLHRRDVLNAYRRALLEREAPETDRRPG